MSFAAEEQLLLALARVALSEDALERARGLLARGLDWRAIIETSIRHGVAPLVSRGLESCSPDADAEDIFPSDARAELRRLHSISSRRNERLLGVVSEVVGALQGTGVPVLCLKDVGLAVELYPEAGLRPLGDLDLLIRESDYPAVASVIVELGFQPLPRSEIPYTLRYAWAHHFHRAEGNVWLDMQWGVMQREWSKPGVGRRSFDPEDLWVDARTVPLGGSDGQTVLLPSPEAALFHLCGHLEGHGYGELILFSDIAAALDAWGAELDWEKVAALAHRYEALATVYHVLRLARELVGARVPEDALALFSGDVFRGAVFAPVFGGLTSLHLALDEILDAAAPPPRLLLRLEREVRSQAARARLLYDELDALVSSYVSAGGDLILLDGGGHARRFPDEALAEFGDVRLVVPADRAETFRAACEARGLTQGRDNTVAVRVDEQVLAGSTLEVTLRTTSVTSLQAMLTIEREPLSNREAALASLRARLPGNRSAARRVPTRFVLASLTDVELLAWLLVRLGSIHHEVLFGLPPLLDFLRLRAAHIDGTRVVAEARRLGLEEPLARGIAIAAQVAAVDSRLASVMTAVDRPLPAPRALAWARESPAGLERHPHLRSAYLYLLCLLNAGADERTALLRSGLRRRNGRPAPLLEVTASTARGLTSLLRRRQADAQQMAYWLEA